MSDIFSKFTTQGVIILMLCVGVIFFRIRSRWNKSSKYVDERNELFSEHYRKINEYAARVRKDGRWAGFLSQIQSRYQVIDLGPPPDDQTFVVHYCSIWDEIGKQYEPDEDTTGRTSISAFLKRKAKPKYLSFTLSPTGNVTEEKIGGSAWYDMFEKSV
ncbi:MAG: hypothetical protein KAR40_00060 [Candidatus Sabulitectum sp.]|nr:hypothetical protein [Candidatus Sabulitectum sp.]